MKRIFKAGAIALAAGAACGSAFAQASNEDLQRKIDSLQQQLDEMRAQMQADKQARAQAPAPAPAPVAAAPAAPTGAEPLQRKPGEGFTILTRGGEATLYANLDLSLDTSDKGISDLRAPDGSAPVGNGGWMADISSNISYAGIRGFQSLGNFPANFIYQLETQIDVSASSGTSSSNSNTSQVVKGGLTSRNSFIGLGSPSWGAVKIGKTDAPYKNSTSIMNPFNGMWGDYAVIMGNSGGDNRVEFGTRLDHSIWYDSPNWSGAQFSVLFSPGQNRASDNSNLAAGEVDCTGGNIPGSGGTPAACNDGAFGNAFSTSLSYRFDAFYGAVAYELHSKVNRTSDLPTYDAGDIADEHAVKIGAQYRFSTGTTVGGIYEQLRRDVPDRLKYQDERSRNGTWLVISQQVGDHDSAHFGWAHAGRTPGDPGQHNTPGGADQDNEANMFTLAWKHQVDKNFQLYTDFAETLNHFAAHYDLGAGGRSVTTDCHDASNPDTTGFDPNGDAPHCWAGGHLKGFSIGAKYTY
jgi:predicted porin